MNKMRELPHVCQKCKEFILPPFEDLLSFSDFNCNKIVEVCRKCKNKELSHNS